MPPASHPHPSSSAPRDLAAHEQDVAQRLGRLARASAPARLRARCLDPAPEAAPPALGRWRTAWVQAAAVLLALGAALGARSSSGLAPSDRARSFSSLAGAVALEVVDDPSVPLFHGLETFDQVAVLSAGSPGVR